MKTDSLFCDHVTEGKSEWCKVDKRWTLPIKRAANASLKEAIARIEDRRIYLQKVALTEWDDVRMTPDDLQREIDWLIAVEALVVSGQRGLEWHTDKPISGKTTAKGTNFA